MKARISTPFRSGISAIITVLTLGCFAAPTVFAATRYWDGGSVDILTNGNGAAITSSIEANGTWNTTILNWDAGASPHVAWNNAGNDTAEFNAGTQTATLGTDVTVGRINNKGGGSAFTIAEGAGLHSITLGAATTIINVAGSTTSGRTLNVNAEVTGSNNLSIQGPTTTAGGAVNLNRVNTFTGTLSINDTTLRIGNGPSAAQLNSGNYAAAISITSTGTFGYSSSLNQTLGGIISGAGALNKNTAGSILTLTNSNSYTGATTINDGKLIGVVGGHHQNSDVTLNNVTAATYGVSITDNTKKWTCKSLACAAAGTLEFSFGAVTPSDSVSPLVVTNLAAFTATPLVNVVVSAGLSPGIYPLMTWGSTSGTIPATPQLTVSNVTVGTTPSLSVTGDTLILVISSTAASVVKDDNALPLNDGNSWVGDSAPTAGEVAKWNNIVTSANTTNLGANTTWAGITIENPSGLVTISGANTLTLGAATIDIDLGTATADLGLNCPLTLGAANIWNVADTRTLTLGGKVSGAFGITKLGEGTAILSSTANDYTGNTNVTLGTLRLGDNNVIPHGAGGVAGNVTVNGMLDLNGKSDSINGLSGSGIIDNTGAATSTFVVGNNSQTTTFGGVIKSTTGNINLTKTGNGTLTLGGANTFTGALSITTGTLAFSNTAPFANISGIAMSGGTQLRPNVGSAEITAPIAIGTVGSTVTITAPNPTAGSGTTQIPFDISGAISGNGNVSFTGIQPTNAYSRIDLNTPSNYTGSTLITCSDEVAAPAQVGNQNIFVNLGIANALPTTTVVTLDGGDGAPLASLPGRFCELNLNGKSQTLAGLTNVTGRTLRVQRVCDRSAGVSSMLTINNATDFEYSGFLGSSTTAAYSNFGLTKSGAGKQTFSGTIGYSRNTIVNQGILSLSVLNEGTVNNNLSTVTIATGATLDLTFTGTDIVDKLYIGGVQQAAGVYGPTATPLTQITNSSGSGTLTVTTGPGYPSWQTANSTTQAANLDHDSDGVPNGIEHFIGGTTNTTGFTPLPSVNTVGGLSITWTKHPSYTGDYGTGYVVETSATLAGPWDTELSPGPTISFPTTNEVKFTFPTPLGTKNFARLKVTGP
jgi:autotransporter-associated beta strand protein